MLQKDQEHSEEAKLSVKYRLIIFQILSYFHFAIKFVCFLIPTFFVLVLNVNAKAIKIF